MSLDVYFREDIRNALQAVAVAHGPMGEEAQQVWLAMGLAFGLNSWLLTAINSQEPGVVTLDSAATPLMIHQNEEVGNANRKRDEWTGNRAVAAR